MPGGSHPASWSVADGESEAEGSGENIAWRADIPGGGWSSPVVASGRVFVTTATGPARVVPRGFADGVRMPETRGTGATAPEEEIAFVLLCLDLDDGSELWRRTAGECKAAHGIHPSNTFATESPATDGERVFVTFGELGDVVAFDLDGDEIWRTRVGRFEMQADFGTGSSLRYHDGRVFLQSDNEESSFVLALDAETGEESWRAERVRGSSWASPTIWTWQKDGAQRDELVCLGAGDVRSYDPVTGDVLWGISSWDGGFAASPAVDGDCIYFGNSGPGVAGLLMAVPAAADGEHVLERGSDPPIAAWSNRRGAPGFPSLLARDGRVWSIGSTGVVFCIDARTGDRVYQSRLPGAQQIVASPWIVDDRIFVLDETGKTFVLGTGDEFELERVNEVPGLYWGTPAVAGDALLLRDSDEILCIRSA